jgi:hypothetical protein
MEIIPGIWYDGNTIPIELGRKYIVAFYHPDFCNNDDGNWSFGDGGEDSDSVWYDDWIISEINQLKKYGKDLHNFRWMRIPPII